MFSCSTRTLHVVQLPSKTRGVSPVRWEWVFPGPRRLINFAFDSAQDLLLCLEVRNPIDRASKLQLHAFSLENGNSHPRGGRMSLHEVPSQVITASFMTVECQHIAFFRPDEPRTHPHARIMVWDWQKGNNILDISTPGGPGGECVFLSERYILVGEVRKNPHKAYLNVIDILNPTDPVLCKFQLPRLANFEQSHIHVASSRRVPVPPRSQGLFVGDPTDKIIFVSILVKEILSLFVLASRLIGLAETRPARPGEVIRWEEWGPDSARFMNFNDEDLDPDTGVRVEIVGTRAFMIERSKLTLYDFNQKLITQDLAKGEASDNLVIQATDSSDWASFEQEVTTCLPYRFIRAAMPREDVRRWINMYASEDGILVEPEMEDGHGKTLEFYSI
ncbi:hypothetical protein APHAL10511_000950 [Amanita phalloides]|nr:hypothetical protein APHAL10511_000950 [Amanita phalloides]